MKNYLTAAALLAAGTAFANAATITLTDNVATNSYATVHGFYLTPSLLSGDVSALSAGETVTLDSLTVRGRSDTAGASVTYGLLVFDSETDNTVIGYSTTTQTSAANFNPTFSFCSTDGGSLDIAYDSEYRFLCVSSDTLSLISTAEDVTTFIYNAGGTGAVANTIAGETMTITQGLVAPGVLGNNANVDGLQAIASAAGQTKWANLGSVVSSVTISTIPEPSAFGLLAGAGALALVAARRRRRAK